MPHSAPPSVHPRWRGRSGRPPRQLIRLAGANAGGGVQPYVGVSKYCQVGGYLDGYDWAYVAAKANSYIIGNCYDGWAVNQQTQTTSSDGVVWQGGYFSGNYTGCGWTKQIWLVSSGGSGDNSCASPDRDFTTYGVLYNTDNPTDGAYVVPISNCDEYANERPWSMSASPTNYLRTVAADGVNDYYNGNPRLKWRYTTLYGNMVMVRDRAVPDGQGNWVFVPRGCLPNPLPYQS